MLGYPSDEDTGSRKLDHPRHLKEMASTRLGTELRGAECRRIRDRVSRVIQLHRTGTSLQRGRNVMADGDQPKQAMGGGPDVKPPC